jgi:hypothetical protein
MKFPGTEIPVKSAESEAFGEFYINPLKPKLV